MWLYLINYEKNIKIFKLYWKFPGRNEDIIKKLIVLEIDHSI